jgi:hypothetical protein
MNHALHCHASISMVVAFHSLRKLPENPVLNCEAQATFQIGELKALH